MEKKNSAGTIALVVLLLIVTIASLILATFAWAKYTSSYENGTANVAVAKWNVTGNSGELTFSQTFTHVVNPNKLAPGTNGSMDVSLDVTGTEVDVAYTMTLVSATNKPTNLKFYATRTGTPGNYTFSDPITVGSTYKSATIVPSTTPTVNGTIYWDWPFTTEVDGNVAEGDRLDTLDGNAAETMVVTVRVNAEQVRPGNQA